MSGKNVSIKNRLLKLKEWLVISEAAKYLSIMFGEEVEKADMLRFGLDGHLKLSVNLVNYAKAKRGDKFLLFKEWENKFRKIASWKTAKTLVTSQGMIAIYFPGFEVGYLLEDDELININGPWAFGPDEKLKSCLLNKLPVEKQEEIINKMVDEAIKTARDQSKKFKGKVPPSLDSFKGSVITIRNVWDLPYSLFKRSHLIDNRTNFFIINHKK